MKQSFGRSKLQLRCVEWSYVFNLIRSLIYQFKLLKRRNIKLIIYNCKKLLHQWSKIKCLFCCKTMLLLFFFFFFKLLSTFSSSLPVRMGLIDRSWSYTACRHFTQEFLYSEDNKAIWARKYNRVGGASSLITLSLVSR